MLGIEEKGSNAGNRISLPSMGIDIMLGIEEKASNSERDSLNLRFETHQPRLRIGNREQPYTCFTSSRLTKRPRPKIVISQSTTFPCAMSTCPLFYLTTKLQILPGT